MGRRDLRFAVFAGAVLWAALAVLYVTLSHAWPVQPSPILFTLIFASIASEVLAVQLERTGVVSLTYPLAVASIVLMGPIAGAALAIAANIPHLLSSRRGAARLAFNAGQTLLSGVLPAWAYVWLGGRALIVQPLSAQDFPSLVLALVAAATLGVVVNVSFSVSGYAIMTGLSLRVVWRDVMSWMVASQMALGLAGIAMAQVMSIAGPAGFALFVVPLMVARQLFQRYLSLREAYADTVRSLVGALEAKDAYTKGHSVRVADYAVRIARAMGFDEERVQRLEYAALLHDVGKVGISRAILAKPERLTSDEYHTIQRHPEIAAHILETVPYLRDIVPVVLHHHERVDGAGYGDHLAGDDIPIEARILAVADSYDAMTSARPYRAGLEPDEADRELRDGSGTQFDRVVVEAFFSIAPLDDASQESA